jgi:hypothetical protein
MRRSLQLERESANMVILVLLNHIKKHLFKWSRDFPNSGSFCKI